MHRTKPQRLVRHILSDLALAFAIVLFVLYDFSAATDESRELGWRDLIPARVEFEDPFTALSRKQISALTVVARVRGRVAAGQEVPQSSLDEAKTLESELTAQGIDIDGLLARGVEIAKKRRAAAEAVVASLDEQQVRIPGYVLPLDYDGGKVTEFLLVPFVGACIHVPPPPPNQIVHVHFDVGYETTGLFAPVWVEGRMKVGRAEHKLSLMDGAADIPVGYSLTAKSVERYR